MACDWLQKVMGHQAIERKCIVISMKIILETNIAFFKKMNCNEKCPASFLIWIFAFKNICQSCDQYNISGKSWVITFGDIFAKKLIVQPYITRSI
jgi:hypothetical protein